VNVSGGRVGQHPEHLSNAPLDQATSLRRLLGFSETTATFACPGVHWRRVDHDWKALIGHIMSTTILLLTFTIIVTIVIVFSSGWQIVPDRRKRGINYSADRKLHRDGDVEAQQPTPPSGSTARINPLTDWRPLSQRDENDAERETLYEGVPIHLRAPLLQWLEYRLVDSKDYFVDKFTATSDALALRIANRLRLNLRQVPAVYGRHPYNRREVEPHFAETFLRLAIDADDALLLDIIDAALADNINPPPGRDDRKAKPDRPADLDVLLKDGGSAYRVNADRIGLERRVDVTITEAVHKVTSSSTKSASHLKAAWRAAYGIRPNPTEAYAEATKAIEAALIPITLPGRAKATLGDVLRHFRENNDKWELAIADGNGAPAQVAPLVILAQTVWHGHRDRHSGTPTTFPVSAEAAEMALHAAAVIVHWVDIGGVRKRSQ
jgi:hypothetical protein